MQTSNDKLKEEETRNNDSLLLSDSLTNLLKSFEEIDFGDDRGEGLGLFPDTLYSYAYLHTQEEFFKSKFISLGCVKEKINLSVICDSNVLKKVLEKEINHVSIEYSDEYIQKVNLKYAYDYVIKHVKDNSYLVEFLI